MKMPSALTWELLGAKLPPRRFLQVVFSILLLSLTVSVSAQPQEYHVRLDAHAPAAATQLEGGRQSAQTTSTVTRPVRSPLCRRNYRAEVRVFNFEPSISLDDFVKDLNERYQANIVLDNDLKALQVSLAQVTAPWTSILRIALAQNRLGSVCMEGGVLRIARQSLLGTARRVRRRPRAGRPR